MRILRTIAEVREWRRAQDDVGLVPTMGNLHAGHLALVAAAKSRSRAVLVSIFVNPLQFGPTEDLSSYPRTFEADRAALEHAGVDAIFAPPLDEMYPADGVSATTIHVAGITDVLCGASRTGHFDGVATVVCKLFSIVTPQQAFFGEKDYQQIAVVRRMAADLCLPVSVVGVATVRERDGLAFSSRNGYLDAEQRKRAVALSNALRETCEWLLSGARDFRSLEARGWAQLADAGFDPDYFEIRDDALARPDAQTRDFRVFGAGYLGRTRLIDNMGVSIAN